MKKTCLAVILVGLVSAGCKGEIALFADSPMGTTPTESNSNSKTPETAIPRPDVPDGAEEACAFIDPGSSPLRRLTQVEYNNTVRDLFDGIAMPRAELSADEKIGNFSANVVAPLGELQTDEYRIAAEAASEAAVADLDTLLADCQTRDDDCAQQFVEDFGRRAWRRSLEQSEIDGMMALFSFGATDYDYETGIRLVIEGVLQSPSFLYRFEPATASSDPVVQLDGFELATRLSYFLWKSSPDVELLRAAEAGELAESANLEAQARRMISDSKARNTINETYLQWFGLDEFEGVEKDDPAFTADMQDSMRAETLAFVDHVMWEDDGRLETLLTADYTFVDQRLAELYGVAGPTDDSMVQATLDGQQRRGILTQPAVLARWGYGEMNVHRGKFVREQLFCQTLPAAPSELIDPPPTFEGQDERSKAEDRLAHTGCGSCHRMMDPIGLAFDNYDPMGRWRQQDEFGNDVVGDAELTATDVNAVLTGVPELASSLAESEEVEACVSQQFFRYAFARNIDQQVDTCTLYMMEDALAKSNGDIKEMLVAMVTTDAFLYRRTMVAAQ